MSGPSDRLPGALAAAAAAEWLLGRSLTRAAIYMPSTPPMRIVFEALSLLAGYALVLSALLAAVLLVRLGWRWRQRPLIGGLLLTLPVLGVAFLFTPPAGWGAVVYHALVLAALLALGWPRRADSLPAGRGAAAALAALALILTRAGVLLVAAAQALGWPGAPSTAGLRLAAEACALLVPLALWWPLRRHIRGWTMAAALLAGAAFAAAWLAHPARTALLAIWSTGLTLAFPWPAYAASAALAVATVPASLRARDPSGAALVLLAAGGLAPALSVHTFFGLIALAQLQPPAASEPAAPRTGLAPLQPHAAPHPPRA